MTVAAVILSATADGAVVDTAGQPRVRRLADIAWSGGALPIVVVAPDPDGAVAAALASTEAVHLLPAPDDGGPAGQMVHGMERAIEEVHETSAALIWPARMVWVGPETVTSLIEAHGTSPDTILRPTWRGEVGWPVLVPRDHLDALRAVDPAAMPSDVIADLASRLPERQIDVGDPGVTHDADTDRDDLPPYEGPREPPGGHVHEWGDDIERAADLAGPNGG
jgi:CTP:molybdopterin cytidylyltransferase MocA